MTLKIAFVDLDGVVIDSSKRFEIARMTEEAYKKTVDFKSISDNAELFKAEKKKADDLYWKTAFRPDLLSLDSPIIGATNKLNELQAEYRIIYLTSRPDTLRMATLGWLEKYNLDTDEPGFFARELVCCAMAFRDGYIKTTVWKPGMVQSLAPLFQAEEVLFIDDDEKTRNAMREAEGTYVKASGMPLFTVKIAASLFDSWE